MTDEQLKNKSKFKYNMSFYYQSTIIYFVVFALYLIVRGEFVDNSYTLIIKDPIIYLLAFIVFISLVALIYNLYRNRYIEFNDEGISFIDRFGSKQIKKSEITAIHLAKDKRYSKTKALRFIRVKLGSRIRPMIIRPNDYENENELVKRFSQLKLELESK